MIEVNDSLIDTILQVRKEGKQDAGAKCKNHALVTCTYIGVLVEPPLHDIVELVRTQSLRVIDNV